jgi:hypothetical protein
MEFHSVDQRKNCANNGIFFVIPNPIIRNTTQGFVSNVWITILISSRMEGYEYCIKHILEDPSAPFVQCEQISTKTNRRCTNPVSINDPTKYFLFFYSSEKNKKSL